MYTVRLQAPIYLRHDVVTLRYPTLLQPYLGAQNNPAFSRTAVAVVARKAAMGPPKHMLESGIRAYCG